VKNPFNEKRAPALFKLFKTLVEAPGDVDVFDLHEKVRGACKTLDPREVQMALSPVISRANKKLEAQGFRVVLGKNDYTYTITELNL